MREGFIDKTGNVVIEPIYERVDIFKEGVALVMIPEVVDSSVKDASMWPLLLGYINKTGEVIIPFEYYSPSNEENHTQVCEGIIHTYKNGTDYYFNTEGELIFSISNVRLR